MKISDEINDELREWANSYCRWLEMESEYVIHIRPFKMGTEKEAALKPLEEAAEAFNAWQNSDHATYDSPEWRHVIYECCDVIQAACNLMQRVGATQKDVDLAMCAVKDANKRRGRYSSDDAD